MKLILSEQSQQARVVNLSKHIPTSIAVHFFAASLLMVLVSSKVNIDYLSHWTSVLVCSLLIRSLVLTLFARMYSEDEIEPIRWENLNVTTTILVSTVFSVAYGYLALIGDSMLWSNLTLIMIIHLSGIILASSSSKQVILSAVLPVTLPFIAILSLTAGPSGYIFAAATAVFLFISLIISFDLHHTLLRGLEMETQFTAEVKVAEKLREKLANSSFVDPETAILNKRFFDLMINEEIRRAKRAGKSLTVALIEVDCYAEYLKNYGQKKTVKTIQAIAKILSDATPRGGEFMTRYGTDKFALIAPDVQQSEMVAFTSKMLYLINKAEIDHDFTKVKDVDQVSISIGIAEFTPGKIIDVKELVIQAEDALRLAVKVGGNNMQVSAANVVAKNVDRRKANPADTNSFVGNQSLVTS